MFHWFRTLSSGNKIAFVLSGSILAASLGYSTASTFVAGSNAMAQPLLPNIISSPLPLPTSTPTLAPSPTVVVSATPIASITTPVEQAHPRATTTPAQSSHAGSNKSDPPQNKLNKEKGGQGQDNGLTEIPAGAAALCHDGTYSFSLTRRGTCSNHGGVDKWLQS